MSFKIIHDHHTGTMSTYNTENKQNFFCINEACRNTANYGHLCMPCDAARGTPKCKDCNYRHAEEGSMSCTTCRGRYCTSCDDIYILKEDDVDNGQCYACNDRDYAVACAEQADLPIALPPECTCDGSGLVCPSCNVEYHENCRGCGAFTNLGLGDYCSSCYLPPPRHTSLKSMHDEIAEIEARLLTNMTKEQKDDWIWILQNRRGDLAEAEKEMWAQYDKDDLNKLDRAV